MAHPPGLSQSSVDADRAQDPDRDRAHPWAAEKKAKALPIEDLERIVAQLASAGTLKAARDNALLQIRFCGGMRKSELVAIEVEHVGWAPEGIEIMLLRSKTDQLGEGGIKAIPYSAGPCCPATALRAWLNASGTTAGPVFRPISRWGVVADTALSEVSVNDVLAACATLGGLDYVPELSSHSLRRGMATSAHRAGADFRDIKKQGGWRHDGTVQGYIEEASRFEENARQLAALAHQTRLNVHQPVPVFVVANQR